MTDIENIIYQFEGQQRKIMLYFHDLLTSDYNLTSKITFKNPCYYGKSWICYLKPSKRNTIELTFLRGNELSNNPGILKNNGRKQLFSLEIDNIKGIPHSALKELFHEAVLLDETIPYGSKEKNKNQ